MSGKGLAYGLNLTKKQSTGSRPPAAKRKPIFGEDDDSDDEGKSLDAVEDIGEFGGLGKAEGKRATKQHKSHAQRNPPGIGPKFQTASYGDLSTSFSSKKHADAAEELDASIYDYDAVYDSLKPQKKAKAEDIERKPKYMANLISSATIRKRDATIAEEKKLAREREAEGEEFADKEKFVTTAYKKQQEENRRLEEEEKIREAEEARKNKGGGMTRFFKNLLDKDEQRHAEIVKAAEEAARAGPQDEEADVDGEKTEADIAREINAQQSGAIAVNDEGQVVDKRQLLKGGLNIVPKPKKATLSAEPTRDEPPMAGRNRAGLVGAGGSKQAMRERQTRMMEAQLEQATKRALETEDEERQRVERAAKSRKTEGEIMSAKERYLARKRAAEEAKQTEQA